MSRRWHVGPFAPRRDGGELTVMVLFREIDRSPSDILRFPSLTKVLPQSLSGQDVSTGTRLWWKGVLGRFGRWKMEVEGKMSSAPLCLKSTAGMRDRGMGHRSAQKAVRSVAKSLTQVCCFVCC